MTGIKEQKQAKTLLEFMGFKDPDLSDPKHDDIIKWLINSNEPGTPKQNLPLNKIIGRKYAHVIEQEAVLSNKFHYYGFVDILVLANDEIDGENTEAFIIEVKSQKPTEGQLIRELHYYKDVTDRLVQEHSQRYVRNYQHRAGCDESDMYMSVIEWDQQTGQSYSRHSWFELNQYYTNPSIGKLSDKNIQNCYDPFIIAIGNVPEIKNEWVIGMDELKNLGFNS